MGKTIMKKVDVLGCSGSGKSTFSVQLHKATGLPQNEEHAWTNFIRE